MSAQLQISHSPYTFPRSLSEYARPHKVGIPIPLVQEKTRDDEANKRATNGRTQVTYINVPN